MESWTAVQWAAERAEKWVWRLVALTASGLVDNLVGVKVDQWVANLVGKKVLRWAGPLGD